MKLSCIRLIFFLALGCGSLPILAQAVPPISGTWFGSIALITPDGKKSHDTAVLVVPSLAVSMNGSMGRTVDQLTLWTGGTVKEQTLTFHLDAAGGLDVSLTEIGDHLKGSATGTRINGSIDLKPAPGLLPHEQLLSEIGAADQQFYSAFERCDVAGYGAMLSEDLEFYQDHTGKTNYVENLQALQSRCSDGIKLRRTLESGSLIVNAVPGFGAIQAGIQQFFSQTLSGEEHLEATARFTNVWTKTSGTWKLVRIISYDHR